MTSLSLEQKQREPFRTGTAHAVIQPSYSAIRCRLLILCLSYAATFALHLALLASLHFSCPSIVANARSALGPLTAIDSKSSARDGQDISVAHMSTLQP